MNPGPPPCQGGSPNQECVLDGSSSPSKLTATIPVPERPPVDNRLLRGFRAWLEGRVSVDTAEYYVGWCLVVCGRPLGVSM